MFGWWFLLLWLFYFLLPFDILPDRIPYVGRVDDLFLLGYLLWSYWKKNRPGSDGRENASSAGKTSSDRDRPNRPAPDRDFRPREKDPYAILGIKRSASTEEIKSAYRLQAGRYHPDKVCHLGGEFQRLAEEKFREIQWAYEHLMTGRRKA